ncbi:miz sp-ring zinc finger domain-containing protein [Cystoisospora suis]|uniref:Miz sp-ring zinc finger domain-containing protein n=1 Tax=Cystoisospora suis TaxID=483139 RepID=A0A2C6LBJ1_9APIC|nr:miz sp-ring zinc finger domain-containing protein [Cystoisospora suis]
MLSIEQLHARTCAELVSMCRELGVAHSGRRKQLLVQALFDYQRQHGPIPPQVVSRATARGAPANGGSRFQPAGLLQAQHSPQALQHVATTHPARGAASINPYNPSAPGYSLPQSLAYTPQNLGNAYRQPVTTFGPAEHHEALLAASAAAQNTSRRAGTLAAGPIRSGGIGISSLPGSSAPGATGGTPSSAPGTGLGGPPEKGSGPAGMFGQCLCHGAVGQPSSRKGHVSALNCIRCGGLNHMACYPAGYNPQNFVCSMCRMKRLDPFYPVKEVLWDARLEVSHYVFELNAQNLRKWRAEGKEVVVRCMQVDLQPLYQSWPKSINIIVNGRTEESVAAPSWEHKRRDMPIPITQYLKNSRNRIEFTWTNFEDPKIFHLAVLLCDTRTPDFLSEEVWKQGRLQEPEARQRVLDIINNRRGQSASSKSSGSGSDSEEEEVMCLEVTRRIKLVCPVTFTRIEIPCRGRSCLHLQCYDLAGYLLVTKNTKAFNTRWKCPECHLYVRPDELVIDAFVQKVLADTDEDATVVELEQDASYRVVSEKELTEESKRAEEQRQLASGEDLRALAADDRRLNEGGSQPAEGPPRKAFEIVEMLSDSDEDAEAQDSSSLSSPTGARAGISSVSHEGPVEAAEFSGPLGDPAETTESAVVERPAEAAATCAVASVSCGSSLSPPQPDMPQPDAREADDTALSRMVPQIQQDKEQPPEPTGEPTRGCESGALSTEAAQEANSDDEGGERARAEFVLLCCETRLQARAPGEAGCLPPQKRARRLVVPSPGDSPRSSHATSPTRTPSATENSGLLCRLPPEGVNPLPGGTGRSSSGPGQAKEGDNSSVTAFGIAVGVDGPGSKGKSVEQDDVDILVVLSSDEDAEENTEFGAAFQSQSPTGRPAEPAMSRDTGDKNDMCGSDAGGEEAHHNASGEDRNFERWSAGVKAGNPAAAFKHELPSDGHASSCNGSSLFGTSTVTQQSLPPGASMAGFDFMLLAAGAEADNPISISDSSEDEEGTCRSTEDGAEANKFLPAFQGNNSVNDIRPSGIDQRRDRLSKEGTGGRMQDENPRTDEHTPGHSGLSVSTAVGEGPSAASVASENGVSGAARPCGVVAPPSYATKRDTRRIAVSETLSAEGTRRHGEQDVCPQGFGAQNTGQPESEATSGARLTQDGNAVRSPSRRVHPVVPPPLFGHRGNPRAGSSGSAVNEREEKRRGSVGAEEGAERAAYDSAQGRDKCIGELSERHGEGKRKNGSVVGSDDEKGSTKEITERGVGSRRRNCVDPDRGESASLGRGEVAERRTTERGEEKSRGTLFERRSGGEGSRGAGQEDQRGEGTTAAEGCSRYLDSSAGSSPGSGTAKGSWWDSTSPRSRKSGSAAFSPPFSQQPESRAASDSTSLQEQPPVTSSSEGACCATSEGISGVARRREAESCGSTNQRSLSANSSADVGTAQESQNIGHALRAGGEEGRLRVPSREEAAAGTQAHHHEDSSSLQSVPPASCRPVPSTEPRAIPDNKGVGTEARIRALNSGSSHLSQAPPSPHVSGPAQSGLSPSPPLAAAPTRPVSGSLAPSHSGPVPFLVPSVHRGPASAIRVAAGVPQHEQHGSLIGAISGHRLRTPEQQLALELHRQRLQRKNQEDLQELLNQQRATRKFTDSGLAFTGGASEVGCGISAQHSGGASSYAAHAAAAPYLGQSGLHGVMRDGTASQVQAQHDSSNECFFSRPSRLASGGQADRFRAGGGAANAETWNQFRSFLNVEGDDLRTSRALTNLFGGPEQRDRREERPNISSYAGVPSFVVDEPLTGGEAGGAARGSWIGRGDAAYPEAPVRGATQVAPTLSARTGGIYPHQLFDQGRGKVSSRADAPRGRHGWGG